MSFIVTAKAKTPYKTIQGIPFSIWNYQLEAHNSKHLLSFLSSDSGQPLQGAVGLAFSSRIDIKDPTQYPDVPQIQATRLARDASKPVQYVYQTPQNLNDPINFYFLAPSIEDQFTPLMLVNRPAVTGLWLPLHFRNGLNPDAGKGTVQAMNGPAVTCDEAGAGGTIDFRGVLPYATELFGVYQPLIGWIGNQAGLRIAHEIQRNHGGNHANAGPLLFLGRSLSSLKDPFISALLSSSDGGVLTPVGLVHLYREYFFELDNFLGPPVGHVWLSPGGTVELFEIHTRKQAVEQTTEISTETSRKIEEDLTQQDDIADAVKEDNANDVKLGVSASGGLSTPLYHADASATLSLDNSRHQSQEDTHKHSRTQSEKVSSEIRRNFKTTFKTVTETTDTNSKRYVIQNTTDKLVNYELRRKMRKVAVQLQHLGTRLAWQVYLDYPGRPLGLGEMVQVVTASDTSSIKPPDPPEPAKPKETDMTVQFPFMPSLTDSNTADRGQDYFIDGLPSVGMHTHNNRDHLQSSLYTYDATPPDAGYRLSGISLKNAKHPNGDDMVGWPLFLIVPGTNSFQIKFNFVNFGNQASFIFDLTLRWDPPAVDPGLDAYNKALADYREKLALALKTDFANAVRTRLKLVSAMQPRPSDDLRAEERDIVYGSVIQQLMEGSTDRHVSSELLRSIFDVDEMLYFVAPDFWLPRQVWEPPVPPPPDPPPIKYPPQPFIAPTDPSQPPDLSGDTVLSWYQYQDQNNNTAVNGQSYVEKRNNYLITEETQPAPKGSSLGWLIQVDGDSRRNEFLNAAWVKAVLPVRPGHELEALEWLQNANVEGEAGLSEPYQMQPGDPPEYLGKTIGEVLTLLATQLQATNTDMQNTLATETVFENGFDPLEGGFRASDPYQIFDQWLEVLPTDQSVAVEVAYDPKSGKEL